MKLVTQLIQLLLNHKNRARKTLADYKQEVLVKQGRDQFERLLKKGLQVPVVFL